MCASAFTSIVLPVPAAPATSTVRSAGVLCPPSTDNRCAPTHVMQQVCKVALVTHKLLGCQLPVRVATTVMLNTVHVWVIRDLHPPRRRGAVLRSAGQAAVHPMPRGRGRQAPPVPRGRSRQAPPMPQGRSRQAPPMPQGRSRQAPPVPRGRSRQAPPMPQGRSRQAHPMPRGRGRRAPSMQLGARQRQRQVPGQSLLDIPQRRRQLEGGGRQGDASDAVLQRPLRAPPQDPAAGQLLLKLLQAHLRLHSVPVTPKSTATCAGAAKTASSSSRHT